MLIDSHCHLSFKDYPPETHDDLVLRATEAGVGVMINIGAGEGVDGNLAAVKVAEKYPQVYATVGMHPHDAALVTDGVLHDLEALARHPKVVAIGEIGLDYHYEHSPRDIQKTVLKHFISLAHKLNKPIMIHDRDAGDETYQILKEHNVPPQKVMIHCFTGSRDLAFKYLDLGYFLSFTGIITFKKAQDLVAIVRDVPLNQLLVETDSPYLTPIPFRGKTNEPAYVKYVAEKVAEIKGISFESVADATTANARGFFGLKLCD